VTSIAYPAKPPLPGWIQTAGALLVGWIVAGLALTVLYLVASELGAIGNAYAYPGARHEGQSVFGARSLSDWPFPDSGLWTLVANVAVVALVLVLATLATSWWLRNASDHFSEGRLALVLLVTGWLPLYAGPIGGFFGFLVTICLVRLWVTRAKDRLPARTAVLTAAVLALVAGSYGLLHPFWTMEVSGYPAQPAWISIYNAAHTPVNVDSYAVSPLPSSGHARGFSSDPFGDGKSTFRFAPRSTRFLVQPLSQGCGTVRLNIHVRYHMFGLPLSQTVPAFTKLGRPC